MLYVDGNFCTVGICSCLVIMFGLNFITHLFYVLAADTEIQDEEEDEEFIPAAELALPVSMVYVCLTYPTLVAALVSYTLSGCCAIWFLGNDESFWLREGI